MQSSFQNKDIIQFLSKTEFSAGLFDTLKIKYRTYICPFIDLIGKVKPGNKVGDIGCGSGQFLLLVSKFADQPSELFGIEIEKRLIDNAKVLFKDRETKSQFEIFDGVHFPEKISEMDILFLIDVLHHVPKKSQQQFMEDLISLMKPGSRLILKDINAGSPLVYFNKMHDMIFAHEIGNEMSMDAAKKLLEQNGLTITIQEKKRMYVYPHYTLVAQKN